MISNTNADILIVSTFYNYVLELSQIFHVENIPEEALIFTERECIFIPLEQKCGFSKKLSRQELKTDVPIARTASEEDLQI